MATAIATTTKIQTCLDPPACSTTFRILVRPLDTRARIVSSLSGTPLGRHSASLALTSRAGVLADPKILRPIISSLQTGKLRNYIPPSRSTLTKHSRRSLRHLYCTHVEDQLNVRLAQSSQVFRTDCQNSSSHSIRCITGLVTHAFLSCNLTSHRQSLRRKLGFLSSGVPSTHRQMSRLRTRLRSLHRNFGLVAPGARNSELTDRVDAFRGRCQTILVRLRRGLAHCRRLRHRLARHPRSTSISSILDGGDHCRALIRRLLALSDRVTRASAVFLPDDPRVRILVRRHRGLLTLVTQRKAGTRRRLLKRVSILTSHRTTLTRALTRLGISIKRLTTIAQRFASLSHRLTVTGAGLDRLLRQQRALRVRTTRQRLP